MTDINWIKEFCAQEKLPDHYAEDILAVIKPAAEQIQTVSERHKKTILVGVTGGQGSGKSTFCGALEQWLQNELGLKALTLSLDDFYYSKARRVELSQNIHPLMITRGVPGTHDVHLLADTIDLLKNTQQKSKITSPVFDKATDDLIAKSQWREIGPEVDVILLEGWCVGARPQLAQELTEPVNELERDEDSDGIWRTYVNDRLAGDYKDLHDKMDLLVMLKVPSFERILEWRSLQEEKLKARLKDVPESARGQSVAELKRFIMHYERITRCILKTMPTYADIMVEIDDQHRMKLKT